MGKVLVIVVVALAAVIGYGVQPLVFPGQPSATFRVVTAADAPILTKYLASFDAQLGADKTAYLNHCLRTLSFAEEFLRRDFGFSEADIAARRPVMETALAFHDIALWSDGALNYIEPSTVQAEKLAAGDLTKDQLEVVRDIIVYHHKFTAFTGGKDDAVVNAVRLVRTLPRRPCTRAISRDHRLHDVSLVNWLCNRALW